jgi:hypothetical protein
MIVLYWYLCFVISRFILPYTNVKLSSSFVSLTHAMVTMLYSGYIIKYDMIGNDIHTFNQNQLMLIKISAGYFVYDTLFMLFNNISAMFLFHHMLILCVYYLTTSYNIGSSLITYTIFWGEITNPLQITWYVSKYLKNHALENYMFPVFSFTFILIRMFVIPYYHYILLYNSILELSTYYEIALLILVFIGDLASLFWINTIFKKIINKKNTHISVWK